MSRRLARKSLRRQKRIWDKLPAKEQLSHLCESYGFDLTKYPDTLEGYLLIGSHASDLLRRLDVDENGIFRTDEQGRYLIADSDAVGAGT